MRHNTAYTFTNEEKNTIASLLYAEINRLQDEIGYDPEEYTEQEKAEYNKLYNLYIQF